jgi:hypothetical protein
LQLSGCYIIGILSQYLIRDDTGIFTVKNCVFSGEVPESVESEVFSGNKKSDTVITTQMSPYYRPVVCETPPPTKAFQSSGDFTFSFLFRHSQEFTVSSPFPKSRELAFSDCLTISSAFENSVAFRQSDSLVRSLHFDFSSAFSGSGDLLRSFPFRASSELSSSDEFTKSSAFDFTLPLPTSRDFSESASFKLTSDLRASSAFSTSTSFQRTFTLKRSNDLTKSPSFQRDIASQFVSDSFSDSTLFLSTVVNSPTANARQRSENPGIGTVAIVGIIAGIIAVICLIAVLYIFLSRRSQSSGSESDGPGMDFSSECLNDVMYSYQTVFSYADQELCNNPLTARDGPEFTTIAGFDLDVDEAVV